MASHEDPSVPVEALPVQGYDKSGDIVARFPVCILPAAIVISAVEVVWIRQLRHALSGDIISLEWDERFASLNIDLSVMDGYRSKGYLEIGFDSLLYLLQFAIHVPLSSFTLRFPKDDAGIGLVIMQVSAIAIEVINSSSWFPHCCDVCFSDMTIGGSNLLEEGDWGTYQWGEMHGDEEITDSVAWSGENHFCDYCWFYKQYVFEHLSPSSTRRQLMLEEYPCRGAYSDKVDRLYVAADAHLLKCPKKEAAEWSKNIKMQNSATARTAYD